MPLVLVFGAAIVSQVAIVAGVRAFLRWRAESASEDSSGSGSNS